MTIKLAPPYSLWDVPGLAKAEGLEHLATLDFDQRAFPGYHHVTTQADAKALRVGSKKDATRCKVGAPHTPPHTPPHTLPHTPPHTPLHMLPHTLPHTLLSQSPAAQHQP